MTCTMTSAYPQVCCRTNFKLQSRAMLRDHPNKRKQSEDVKGTQKKAKPNEPPPQSLDPAMIPPATEIPTAAPAVPEPGAPIYIYSGEQERALQAGVQRTAAQFGASHYSRLQTVKLNEFKPDAPLNVFAVEYERCSAVPTTYFSDDAARLKALTDSGPTNVFSHTQLEDGTITAVEAGYVKGEKPSAAMKRAALLRDGLAKGAATTPVMITNLDAASVAKHATELPGFFAGLESEAKQVDEGVRKCEEYEYRRSLYEQAKDKSLPPQRIRRATEFLWGLIMGVLTFLVGGFGTAGLQVYVKRVTAFTGFHTEICFSSAVNLMRLDSIGVAVWYGFYYHELLQHYTPTEVKGFMARRDYVKLIKEWLDRGIRVWLVYQAPGTVVVSPSSELGAGHCVVSFGDYLMQTAWNRGFTLAAFRACLGYFDARLRTLSNGGAATRAVTTPLRLHASRFVSQTGLDLGLEREVQEIRDVAEVATRRGVSVKWFCTLENRLIEAYCSGCGFIIDLVSFDGQCIHCYLREPLIGEDDALVEDAAEEAAAVVPLYWCVSIKDKFLQLILAGEKGYEFRNVQPRTALAEMRKRNCSKFQLFLHNTDSGQIDAMVTITAVAETSSLLQNGAVTEDQLRAMGAFGATRYRYAWRIEHVWKVCNPIATVEPPQGLRHAQTREIEHLLFSKDALPGEKGTVIQYLEKRSAASAAPAADPNELAVRRCLVPANLRWVRAYPVSASPSPSAIAAAQANNH